MLVIRGETHKSPYLNYIHGVPKFPPPLVLLAHTDEGRGHTVNEKEMVQRDPGQSATPHVAKAAAATKATLMLLLTR